jgi:hypothetical protein
MLKISEEVAAGASNETQACRQDGSRMKKLLFTVSDDPNMFNGLRFLCRFFQSKDRFDLTLLCMASPDSAYCRWRAGADDAVDPVMDNNWRHAREEALRMLEWDGFKLERVQVKSASSMLCRIEDIEEEIGSEAHDAVVMGRRGLNRLKDFTQKSLSRRLFERQPEIPMILCRKPDLNRRNVLLCVDGSESAYSMTRFVASMLEGESHSVTLCNITKDTSEDRDRSMSIFKRCEEIMRESGFDGNRLRFMIYPSDYTPRAILDNANWGKYAVVAVGNPGDANRNSLHGSVGSYLFTELSGSVLWMHP